jgi:uncharacterized cupredoxin-like copper-binding protein
MIKHRLGALALVVVTAALVWALPAGAQQSTAQAKATKVVVSAGTPTEFKFKLSKLTVPKGVVTFVVTNKGQLPHDFKIAGKTTKLLQTNKSQTLKITFKKAGKYPYLCTVSGHAAAGMKGVLRVK